MSKDAAIFILYSVLMVSAWLCGIATLCAAILNDPVSIYFFIGIIVFMLAGVFVDTFWSING